MRLVSRLSTARVADVRSEATLSERLRKRLNLAGSSTGLLTLTLHLEVHGWIGHRTLGIDRWRKAITFLRHGRSGGGKRVSRWIGVDGLRVPSELFRLEALRTGEEGLGVCS